MASDDEASEGVELGTPRNSDGDDDIGGGGGGARAGAAALLRSGAEGVDDDQDESTLLATLLPDNSAGGGRAAATATLRPPRRRTPPPQPPPRTREPVPSSEESLAGQVAFYKQRLEDAAAQKEQLESWQRRIEQQMRETREQADRDRLSLQEELGAERERREAAEQQQQRLLRQVGELQAGLARKPREGGGGAGAEELEKLRVELETLRGRQSQNAMDVLALQTKLSEAQSARAQSQQTAEQLLDKLERLREESSRRERDASALQGELLATRQKLRDAEQTHSSVRSELSEQSVRDARLSTQLGATQEQLRALQEELRTAKAERQQSEEHLAALRRKLMDVQQGAIEQRDRLQAEYASKLDEQAGEHKIQLQRHLDHVEELTRRLASNSASHIEELEAVRREHARRFDELSMQGGSAADALRKEHALALEDLKTKASRRQSELQQEHISLMAKLKEQFAQERGSLSAQATLLDERCRELEARALEAERLLAAAQKDNAHLGEHLEHTDAQVQLHKREEERLSAENNDLGRALLKAREQVAELERRNRSLDSNLASESASASAAGKQLRSLQDEVEELRPRAQAAGELEAEVAQLRQELEASQRSLTTEVGRLRSQLEERLRHRTNTESVTNELRASLAAERDAKRKLFLELEKLRGKLDSEGTERKELTAQNVRLQQQVDELKMKYSKETTRLRRKIVSSDVKAEEMQQLQAHASPALGAGPGPGAGGGDELERLRERLAVSERVRTQQEASHKKLLEEVNRLRSKLRNASAAKSLESGELGTPAASATLVSSAAARPRSVGAGARSLTPSSHRTSTTPHRGSARSKTPNRPSSTPASAPVVRASARSGSTHNSAERRRELVEPVFHDTQPSSTAPAYEARRAPPYEEAVGSRQGVPALGLNGGGSGEAAALREWRERLDRELADVSALAHDEPRSATQVIEELGQWRQRLAGEVEASRKVLHKELEEIRANAYDR